MMEEFDQSNIERLIINTVTVLCKNSIPYSSEMRVQGTLGITIDASSMVLVQINEHFGRDVKSSDVNASALDGRHAADTIPENTSLPAKVKRLQTLPVVHSTRRTVGRGRGCRPIRQVRNVRLMSSTRQQPVLSSPGNLARTKPHAAVTSQCKSPQFHAGHVLSGGIPVKSETPQHVTSKVEVEERGQSGSRMSQRLLSPGVICVDSDDETENAADMKPDVSASVLNSVTNRQSPDALQKILDTALMAARAGNPCMVRLFWMLFYVVVVVVCVCVSFLY